jgi:signal transduction histidine kinase
MPAIADRVAAAEHPCADELQRIEIFSDLSKDDRGWLAERMSVVDLVPDEVFVRPGDPADYMFALLAGEIRSEIENGRSFVVEAGDISGMLPFSRLKTFPATARSSQRSRVALLHKDLFNDVLHRLPVLQGRLVSLMADRVREAAAADQQRAKMAALGKLSAGLAHELNNPAAAARRAADNLRKSLRSVRGAALRLDKDGLPQESRVFLAEMECKREAEANLLQPADALERSDREDEISAWLRDHTIDAAWDLAPALADLGFTIEKLEEVAQHVPLRFLSDTLVRLTAAFTITRLTDQIESATARMSELVRAIKEYSYMDRAPMQDIDIHDGIENTLIMLHHRLKRGVEVIRQYDRSLPKVEARGSELNQIWTNLIVNAADAMQDKGTLTIRTLRDNSCARIEVTDNGPGIPPEIRARIFEPFFTTKPIGEGTGLGLDVVYRIVRAHGGDIGVESHPGETRFVVRLPFQVRPSGVTG